jgi:glycosyltransferase involved in cell wall biosynthesis
MRIAVASSGLGHIARGIESWASDLGHALARRGVDVRLYKGGGTADSPIEEVIPCWQRAAPRTQRVLRWIPSASWRLGLNSGYGIEQSTFALGLIRRLRHERSDILHVQDPQLALLLQRARDLGLVRTRTILAHGTEEPFEFQQKIHYLQHLAPWHAEEAREAGVWRTTWTAIPNFIDLDRFGPAPGPRTAMRHKLGLPDDALVVLTVAAIKRHHKRIDALLAEFARLREAHPALPAYLVVAGGREADTDDLVRQGQALLGDRVRFLVRFPRPEMPDLYRAADAFVLASLKEMMPIAVLEACASGLPCVVNRHPVLEWMVGKGGLAIDMAGHGELADALAALLGDPARRAALGAQAREHCAAEFGRDRVVDRLLDYYRFVLRDRD